MKRFLVALFVAVLITALLVPVAFAAVPQDPVKVVTADETEVATVDDTGTGIWEYIVEKAYILIPVLYIIGFLIKKIPKVPDWIIPFVLLVVGVVVAMAILGWSVENALQGVLVAGATVLLNQAYKQAVIKRKE